MFNALRHRAISRLWFGQALSSIGDEIYRVGLTWMAVNLIGADAGYLSAGQAAALMVLSFIGGKWADAWEPLNTMVGVDLLRAGLVLIPVVVSMITPLPLWLLCAVALTLSALSAFFDPALQTALPRFAPDLATLRAATGLMGTTVRLARMAGPSLVGLLAGVVPPIHFFTMDAVSFGISALSVSSVRAWGRETGSSDIPAPEKKRRQISLAEAIVGGFQAVRRQKGMSYVLLSKALTGGTWNLAYTLGFALLAQEMAPGEARTFGFLMASYGVGNFLGALYFGNHPRPRPGLMMFTGYLWLGAGFVITGFCRTIPAVMVVAALSGFSGPMNDVTFVDLVQARFPIGEMTRIFRLRMALDTAATLALMLVAPTLFRLLSVRVVIALAGVLWIVVGAYGLRFVREVTREGDESPPDAARG